jgi:hypothetical protein
METLGNRRMVIDGEIMTREERNKVRKLVERHGGNTHKAIAEHLGAESEFKAAGNKIPIGWEAAFHGIAHEVESDDADLDAIDASDANAQAKSDAAGGNSDKPKANGKTKAKAKGTVKK